MNLMEINLLLVAANQKMSTHNIILREQTKIDNESRLIVKQHYIWSVRVEDNLMQETQKLVTALTT